MAPEMVAQVLSHALAQHKAVRISHTKAGEEQPTTRVVVPYWLVQSSKGRTYVHTFCTMRKARRSFRLDRINSVEIGSDTVSANTYAKLAVEGLAQAPMGQILAHV